MPTAEKKLSKESLITIFTLLKSFYDDEVFLHFTREYYNSDVDISLTAIESSAVIGNEHAVPHLYKIIEKGKTEQKIAAIRALAAIRAPSAVAALVKYFSIFPEKEIRVEILRTLTAIGLDNARYQELVKNVVTDPHSDEDLQEAASDGIIALNQLESIKSLIKNAPLKVRKNLIKKSLHLPAEWTGDLFQYSPDMAKTLDSESLGYMLAGYFLCFKQPDQKLIISALTGKTRGAVLHFLRALLEYEGEVSQPLRVFKLLLIIPYVNRDTEKLTGDNLEKVVGLLKEKAPYAVNELVTITVAHLEALFGKIKKNFLSMSGVVQKEVLLSLLFARLMENYASPSLFEDVQRYFKGFKSMAEDELIRSIQHALVEASEEERNQFKACVALFNPNKKAEQMKTLTMLSNVDLGRPFLQRRLNRFVRLAGLLGIKTMIKNIQKILDFARQERIGFLEETTVVSLCQLYDKPTLDRAPTFLARPQENPNSLKGYVRGLRFCEPPLYLRELGELLLKPDVPGRVKMCALDTFDRYDLKNARAVVPLFIKAFFVPSGEPQLKRRLEGLILRWGEANIFQAMLGFLNRPERDIRTLAIRSLREITLRDAGLPREVLVNRYYLLLEDDDRDIKQEALVALLALKDDYAIQVFADYFKTEHSAELPALLERLPRPLTHDVVRYLFQQIGSEDKALQRTLRGILAEVTKGDFAEELRNVLLDFLNRQLGKVIKFSGPVKPADGTGLVEQAKAEFKFKRENAQILTVFFCDIVSYTEKTTQVNASSLMTLIRSFEGIVFPLIAEYRGQIIKTLGDGILAVFKHPLNAVLTALVVQKKIQEHNQFKIDTEKFFVRIGLNTGQVIRKQNDVYGDVVNVASRMQAAANPGDILLTLDTYEEIKNYIKCTPLGKIKVKGKEEAISVYTAQEVKVDFNHLLMADKKKAPEAKKGAVDPITNLKQSMFTPVFAIPEQAVTGRVLMKALEGCFQSITRAVEEIAKDYHEEYEFKKYLQKRWDLLANNWEKLIVEQEESRRNALSS